MCVMYIICMYIIIHIYVLYVCIDIRMIHQIISMGKKGIVKSSYTLLYTVDYKTITSYAQSQIITHPLFNII